MAKRAMKPEDLMLFALIGNPVVETPVMCLTQNAVNMARAEITHNNFCETGSTPGTLTIEVPFQGEAYVSLEAPGLSAKELQDMIRAGEIIDWKISPVEPKEGDEIDTFSGWLSQADKGGQKDGPVTFTCNIKVDPSTYDPTIFTEQEG